ncbi:MAG: phosphatidate cytidylyltransferase [Armatimonadota bacterium]
MLLKRVITGSILAFGTLALIIWSPTAFWFEIAVLAVLGLKEFFYLRSKQDNSKRPLVYTTIIAAVTYMASMYYFLYFFKGDGRYAAESKVYLFGDARMLYLLTIIIIVVLVVHLAKRNFQFTQFADVSTAVFGFVYVPYFLSYLFMLRTIPGEFIVWGTEVSAGACFVIYLIFITAFCDMGAFFVGKYLGRNKLWPQISPKKTIEGAVGGLICSIIIAYFMGKLLGMPVYNLFGIPVSFSIFLGMTLAIAAQLGDLFESLLKREAGVKDSGSILAGHGGILDRFDSYFFTAPIMYILIKIFVLP